MQVNSDNTPYKEVVANIEFSNKIKYPIIPLPDINNYVDSAILDPELKNKNKDLAFLDCFIYQYKVILKRLRLNRGHNLEATKDGGQFWRHLTYVC